MLAHELLAPGKHVDKTYFVRVEGKLTVEKIEKLENGVDIGEKKLTMPAKVEIVGGSWEGAGEPEPGRVRRENLPEVYTELHLTIHEGKFHQVKRMMASSRKPRHLPQKNRHGSPHPARRFKEGRVPPSYRRRGKKFETLDM